MSRKGRARRRTAKHQRKAYIRKTVERERRMSDEAKEIMDALRDVPAEKRRILHDPAMLWYGVMTGNHNLVRQLTLRMLGLNFGDAFTPTKKDDDARR